jgi:TonB-dependent receptor
VKLSRALLVGAAANGLLVSGAGAQSSSTPSVTPGYTQPAQPDLTGPIDASPAPDRAAVPQAGDATTPAAGEIVVTGIRASQRAALELKRNAPVIVDAITATDVGKFPDTNIADALQRVTGVSIDRSNGEGRFITVRGFGPQYNEVLVNGRTMATDNIGREFSFDILSASLISRAEVYKTSQPSLQEGGIGATVNIVTAHPLDAKTGLHVAAQAGGIYDFLSTKATPDAGGIATWKNEAGTFGVEASVNYTKRKSFDDSVTTDGWSQVAPNSNTVAIINGTPNSVGLTPANISYLNAGGTQNLYIPQNVNARRGMIDQSRLTANGTVQWKPTDRLLVTVDGIWSRFVQNNTINYFAGFFTPPYFSDVAFDKNGTLTHFTRPGTGFAANNPLVAADPRFSNQQNDNVTTLQNRTSKSYQFGGNLKWEATDRLKLEGDISRSHATQDYFNPFTVVGSNPVGAPQFSLVEGQTLPSYINPSSTTDPSVLRTHYSNITGHTYRDVLTEGRLQGEYDLDLGILKNIQFGGYYSHRDKSDDEYSTPSGNDCAYCGYVVPIDPSLVSVYNLKNYLPKASGGAVPAQFFQFDPLAVQAFESLPATLAQRSAGQKANAPTDTFLNTGGYGEILFPGRGFDVKEQVWAGYFNTNWKGPHWALNVGVRVSVTDTTSTGFDQPLTSIQQNVGDSNLKFTYGPVTQVSVKNHYVNALPSANLKVDATDKLVLRGAVSETITRPTLSNLGTNNSYGGRVTQALSSGGNPLLTPFKSWNFDGSAEWYLSSNTSFSGDVFHKRFSGFISNQTVIVPRAGLDAQGNAVTYNFYDTRPRNGNKGTVTGFELAAQHSFGGTGLLSGSGIGANYTHVSSNQKIVSPGDCRDIEGLSKDSYNVSGFYEKYGIHARIAYNWRAKFLAVCQGLQGQPQNTAAYGQVDFNLAYDVTPHFQVYVEGVNITDSYYHQYSVYTNRFISEENFGRRILFGVRAKF